MKKSFYIDYPQVPIEDQAQCYCCAHCKVSTTVINGRLEGHLPTCAYRIELQRAGYDADEALAPLVSPTSADDVD